MGIIKRIVGYVMSMRFALVILLVIAVFMVIASFVSSSIFTKSYLFAFLAGLLFLSLLVCSIRRIIRIPEMIKRTDSCRAVINSIGSPLLHVGVLLLVAGMVMAQFTGFEDNATLATGDSYISEGMDFEVRLDSFQIIYDEDYNIIDYISTVTVIEDGKEVMTREITVNNPLEYKGVKFYQSTYGWAAGVKIAEKETGEVLLDNVLNMDVSAKGIGSVEYSMYDEESETSIRQQFIVVPDQVSEGSVNTYTPLPNNPALFFVLYYGSGISIIQDVGLGESEDVGGLMVSFEGLDYYSGLSVSSKPELPIVFIGSLIFIVGLIVVFYVRKGVNASQEVEDIGG